MSKLAEEFSARLHAAILECHRLGYHPTRFEQMLRSTDAVSLAKRLVASGDLQDGLRSIKRLNRIDLSMEQIMLEPQFKALFDDQERAAASWRLSQL